ncbi:MAG: CmpA/NrtA family ABC transporter substrate-binding protein [Acetobacteraceae bacterium]
MRLGMVRLTDAAPLVYAQVHGLFAARGIEVQILVEASWANVSDKLAWGLLDGAVMLPPLAIAMVLGLRGPATPLLIPAGISLNGNAITLTSRLADELLRDGPAEPAAMAARLRPMGRLRLAVVHAFSTHDLFLRRFLEQGGIDPDTVGFSVVPPADMAAALAAGQMDGFCAGGPWGAVAAEAGAGRTVAVTSQLWPNHPEKCLAVRTGWAEANPETLQSVLQALLLAGRACDDPQTAPALAGLLAGKEWLDVPAALIARSLPGGAGGEVDRSVFAAHDATVPVPGHGRWFLEQMARQRAVPDQADAIVTAMYRPDLQAAAVSALGEQIRATTEAYR